jgi:hypothetical protein
MVSVHHQKRGQLATKSLGSESLEKCDNIKLKKLQFQDERALCEVQDLHH